MFDCRNLIVVYTGKSLLKLSGREEAPLEPEFAISLIYKQVTPLESVGRLLIALEELPVYREI